MHAVVLVRASSGVVPASRVATVCSRPYPSWVSQPPDHNRDGRLSADVGCERGNPSLQNSLISPQPLSPLPESMQPETAVGRRLVVSPATRSMTSIHRVSRLQVLQIETGLQNLEDAGILQDDKWHLADAHKFRFCVRHEEYE